MKRILLFLATTASLLLAQPSNQEVYNFRNSSLIGLNAGYISGLGPSYRHWFDHQGVQISLLPLYFKDKDYSGGMLDLSMNHLVAITESTQRTFWDYRTRSLSYFYWGAHYMLTKDQGSREDWYYNSYTNEYSHSNDFYDELKQNIWAGGGFGVQTIVGDMAFSIGVGYMGYFSYDMDLINNKRLEDPERVLAPTIDINISYVLGK